MAKKRKGNKLEERINGTIAGLIGVFIFIMNYLINDGNLEFWEYPPIALIFAIISLILFGIMAYYYVRSFQK